MKEAHLEPWEFCERYIKSLEAEKSDRLSKTEIIFLKAFNKLVESQRLTNERVDKLEALLK